jgi:hypothetical protein
MRTIEDNPPSPELGHPTTPPRAPQFSTEPSETIDKDQDEEVVEEEEEEEEEPVPKKKRTLKRDTREWTLLPRLDKGDQLDQAGFDDEVNNHLVYQEARKKWSSLGFASSQLSSQSIQIFICGSGRSGGARTETTYTNVYMCPLETRFGCSCQLRVANSPTGTTLEMRGTHDAMSHAPEKDQSKFLKLQQIEAIRVAPKQSAKHLRRIMMYSSPPKRIGPDLARSVERRVRLFRAQLTEEKIEMDGVVMDASYASLVAFVMIYLFLANVFRILATDVVFGQTPPFWLPPTF